MTTAPLPADVPKTAQVYATPPLEIRIRVPWSLRLRYTKTEIGIAIATTLRRLERMPR